MVDTDRNAATSQDEAATDLAKSARPVRTAI
jgi:hypothetical protein